MQSSRDERHALEHGSAQRNLSVSTCAQITAMIGRSLTRHQYTSVTGHRSRGIDDGVRHRILVVVGLILK